MEEEELDFLEEEKLTEKTPKSREEEDYDDFGGYGDYTNVDRQSDLLKSLTSYDESLKTLYLEWVGLQWDAEQEKFVKDKTIQPKMNKKGALASINFIRTYADKNNVISHADEDSIRAMLVGVTNVVYKHFMDKYEEYEIRSLSDAELIIEQILDKIEICLSGLYGNKSFVDFLGNTTSFNQSTSASQNNTQAQPQKRGLWSSVRKILPGG